MHQIYQIHQMHRVHQMHQIHQMQQMYHIFKIRTGRFLGPFLTDADYHNDIYPGIKISTTQD